MSALLTYNLIQTLWKQQVALIFRNASMKRHDTVILSGIGALCCQRDCREKIVRSECSVNTRNQCWSIVFSLTTFCINHSK